MKLESLRDLYVEQLRDLYDAEKQLVEALPKMSRAASAPDLQQAFESHLHQTREHVLRLEKVLAKLGEKPEGETCKAMKGLIKEGEEMIDAKTEPEIRDAGLVAAAQRVEHYEMAAYGTVKTFAGSLDDEAAVRLLEQTLQEEKEADKKLTDIAVHHVNADAMHSTTHAR